MSGVAAKMGVVAASLPCRVLVLAFGVLLFAIYGVTVIANLINPMSLIDFVITIYIAAAGVFAFLFFFTKRLSHLLVVLPVIIYFGIAFLLWPPH